MNLPNKLTVGRIILVPFFVAALLANFPLNNAVALIIFIAASLTDMFDGKIARKFNQVTELGKFLDPVADKLTLGVIIVCLATRYREIWLLAGLFLIKEGFMAVMGMLLLRRNGRKLDGAKWFGKVCTAVSYIVVFLLLLLPDLPIAAVRTLVILCAVVMLYTLFCYIPVFRKMWKEP